jgi:8-oxo-dGTP diphosphatase
MLDRPEELIRAAGGMIVRQDESGKNLVAVAHRPERIDWSFPKGKLDPGETFEQAAVREVFEETGYLCKTGRFVGHTHYRDRKDRPKVVAYWVMEIVSGTFTPNVEVDELRWVEVHEAYELLTYERDRELIAALRAALEEIPLSA